MTQRELRAENRRKTITISKVNLHSQNHHSHSFHLDLNCTQAWNLLYTMSVKKWQEENNKIAPLFVDKTVVRKISLKDR